jgi:hypothetical protein
VGGAILRPLRVDGLRIDSADADHTGDDHYRGEQNLGTDFGALDLAPNQSGFAFRFDAAYHRGITRDGVLSVILGRLRRASKAEGSLSEKARFTPLKPSYRSSYRNKMIFIFSKSKVTA